MNVGGPCLTAGMSALMDVTREQVSTLRDLVDMARSIERTISSLQAARDGVLALGSKWALEVAAQNEHPDHADMTLRTAAAELGAALRDSDRTVQRRMVEADVKVNRFPVVWAAQGAGTISASHARAIIDAADHLDDAAARDAYSQRMVTFAQDESPNRVTAMARRIVEQYQPRSLDERHGDAREGRSVWVNDRPDGMAELGILGPAALIHGAFDRLTSMAGAVQTTSRQCTDPGERTIDAGHAVDSRTKDQLRADIALDVLLTGAPVGHDTPDAALAAITGHVSVTVPVLTLMGRPDGPPAELDGVTPIDLPTARTLAGAASGWDRILTDPITGGLLAVDRYRPGQHLGRHLRARDGRCRFIGCRRPARASDIDHHHDAALGGRTSADNLGHFCRRHHMLKHHSPWQVEQRDGGDYAWTSPTGQVYTDRPPPQHTVTFTEDAVPAPF